MTNTDCANPLCGHPGDAHSSLVGCTAELSTVDGSGSTYCTCLTYTNPMVTPYHGGTDSGWSGSDASRERAERRDADGSTHHIQQELLEMARQRTMTGLTVAEARGVLDAHHGTVSGALSVLHKEGLLARLEQKRDRCQVYVLPEYVEGRRTAPQGRKAAPPVVLTERESHAVAYLDQLRDTLGGDPREAVEVTLSLLGRIGVQWGDR